MKKYICPVCHNEEHKDGAAFCMICGHPIPIKALTILEVGTVKRKVASFDEFAHVCQYFTGEYDVNNGYGCTHPEQEETGLDENDIERGKCYCHSCPLGTEPDEEDFQNPNVDWDGITREDCTSSISGHFSIEGDYIMVDVGPDATDDQKRAWSDYERWINRYNPGWKESADG